MHNKIEKKLWHIAGWFAFVVVCFIYYAAIAPIIKLIFK
tara:strand:+ start:420 stop:536 length:117 start_codon:yes stop_codon:yes gene_type:complete